MVRIAHIPRLIADGQHTAQEKSQETYTGSRAIGEPTHRHCLHMLFSSESLLGLHQEHALACRSVGVEKMNEAVSRSQSVESDTCPGSQVVFANLIVLDFEPSKQPQYQPLVSPSDLQPISDPHDATARDAVMQGNTVTDRATVEAVLCNTELYRQRQNRARRKGDVPGVAGSGGNQEA